MASVVDIYNMALLNLGKEPSITATTDASIEAATLNALYATSRDELLEMRDWTWAKRFSGQLSALSDDNPNPHYSYWYHQPPDSLRIRKLEDSPNALRPTDFDQFNDPVQGKVFACNLESVIVSYTGQILDTGLFSSGFTITLTWLLAAKSALPLTSNPQVLQGMNTGFIRTLSTASANILNVEPQSSDADWIAERE